MLKSNEVWSIQRVLDAMAAVPIEIAALRLEVSPRTVRRMLEHHQLEGVRRRNHWWVSTRSITSHIQDYRYRPTRKHDIER